MTELRFKEIVNRNTTDKIKLCFELHSESFKPINYSTFTNLFQQWLQFFGGGNIDDCIAYFKKNKVQVSK